MLKKMVEDHISHTWDLAWVLAWRYLFFFSINPKSKYLSTLVVVFAGSILNTGSLCWIHLEHRLFISGICWIHLKPVPCFSRIFTSNCHHIAFLVWLVLPALIDFWICHCRVCFCLFFSSFLVSNVQWNSVKFYVFLTVVFLYFLCSLINCVISIYTMFIVNKTSWDSIIFEKI